MTKSSLENIAKEFNMSKRNLQRANWTKSYRFNERIERILCPDYKLRKFLMQFVRLGVRIAW